MITITLATQKLQERRNGYALKSGMITVFNVMILWMYLLFSATLIALGIGSLVAVVRSKQATTKYVAGIVAFVVAGFFIIQYVTRREQVTTEEKRIAGLYELNERRSDMAGYTAAPFGRVQLQLKPDNTFTLDKDVPFLPGKQGTWRHVEETNVQHSELIFTDASADQRQPIRFSAWGDSLIIYNALSRGEVPFVPALSFGKK